jgi:ElaB/YqjD/DUF883 family membrane-anchored ribosome-binding protein
MTGYSSDAEGLLGNNWLTRAVKKNPEGWLLLGAACALLLRQGSGSSNGSGGNGHDYQTRSSGGRGADSWSRGVSAAGIKEGIGDRVGEMADKVSGAARSYGDQISDKASELSHKASELTDKASDYMHSAQDRLRQETDRLSQEGQVWMEKGNRMIHENPLAVAALGFGAGALVAALLPPTETEERFIGPARDSIAGAAKEMGGRMLEAAKETGNQLKQVAEERGLGADSLKQTANDLAGTFKDSLSKDSSSKSGGQAGQEGSADKNRSRHIQ